MRLPCSSHTLQPRRDAAVIFFAAARLQFRAKDQLNKTLPLTIRPWRLVAIAVFLAAAALSAYVIWVSDHDRVARHRADVSVLTGLHANAVQLTVERALSSTYALAALIRQGRGEIRNFEAVAAQMLPFYQGASALQLAPGGIVSRSVPLVGNERAIGHNLLRDPSRDKEAIRARDTGQLTLAGPFKLLQGGIAAAGRLPVYLDDEKGQAIFWGFVSVLMRFPDTLESANLPELANRGYDYELWRLHPDSGSKQVIGASTTTALVSPVERSIEVPGATWTLSVAPRKGWAEPEGLAAKALAALLVSLILAALADLMLRLREHQAELETRVSERTRELAESEQRMLSILDGVDACIYIKDTDYRYQFANRALRELFGADTADIVGAEDDAFFDTAAAVRVREIDRRVIEQGETVRAEATNTITSSGAARTYWSVKLPLRDKDGHIYALCGISTDITERKSTETAIANSEARYRALFADNTVVMLLIDPANGLIVDANNAAAAYYGYPLARLKAMQIGDINTFSADEISREMQLARDHARSYFEFRHRLAGGEERDVHVSSGPIVLEGRTLLLSTVQDITERRRAQKAVQESEERFRNLFESIENISVQGYDRVHRAIFWNRASEALYGYPRQEALGRTIEDLIVPAAMRGEVSAGIDQWIAGGRALPAGELMLQRRDGEPVPVFSSRTLQVNSRGEPEIYCVDIDLTRKYETEARMREALVVFNASSEGIMTTNAHGVIIAINPAFSAITGYPAEEVIGQQSSILKSGRHDVAFYDVMWASLAANGHWEGEIWNRRKNGEIYPQWLSISSVRAAQGQVIEYVALFSDITERKQHEEVVWRQANFDALTGLANRNLLADRLERALAQARRDEKKVGLVFLDLDGFKWINDTLGHNVGDELLVDVAKRLKGCIRDRDTAARLGGDEFTLVIHDLNDANDMLSIGEKVVGVLRDPFTLAGKPQQISGSVGITIYPDDGEDVQTLLKNADIAMYKAKQAGKNRYQFYARHMQVDAQARMQLETDLREAIEQNAFALHYQPIIDADSGELVGAEALLRWQHPQRGMVSPMDFIPVAEDCGLIIPIGEWALREAASQWRAWHLRGYPALRLAVNVSGVQFREAKLSKLVADILDEYQVTPGCLMLEITESVLMEGGGEAEARMREIKAQGVGYSLDDFGTGFSSLSYLKRFPIDIVKIDRSFVNDCPHDRNDARLVEAIINMAHGLDLLVTAEGVETEDQLEFLRDLGCDFLQGYLVGRPLPAEAFEVLIERRQLLLPTDGASIEESRFLAALRQDELDLDEWLRRLLGERSPELSSYVAERDWTSRGLDLKHAIQGHLDWRRRLDDFVGAGNSQQAMGVEDAGAVDRCALGHWILENQAKGEPCFDELDRVHREFHRMAGQIVSDCSNGYRWIARHALAGVRFRKASRDVVVALIDCYRSGAEPAP